jgi:acetylornithine deacetylase/succinyl-diaminopimelate desuccinylase-like protein
MQGEPADLTRVSEGAYAIRAAVRLAVPAFCYGPKAEKVHGFNERVSLESIRQTTKAIALFVAEWCGIAQD